MGRAAAIARSIGRNLPELLHQLSLRAPALAAGRACRVLALLAAPRWMAAL